MSHLLQSKKHSEGAQGSTRSWSGTASGARIVPPPAKPSPSRIKRGRNSQVRTSLVTQQYKGNVQSQQTQVLVHRPNTVTPIHKRSKKLIGNKQSTTHERQRQATIQKSLIRMEESEQKQDTDQKSNQISMEEGKIVLRLDVLHDFTLR